MLEGEITQIQLLERFVELWRGQFTGAIRFESDGIIKIIYFKGGDILSASTNDRADSIDEILMRAGKVSRDHVKQALAKRKENETLGDALLNLGFITRKELTWARRVQVVGVIRSINAWETGSFTIVADYLPKRDEGTLFPLPQILIELIVTDPDRQKFERLLEGGNAVYARTPEFDEQFRRLGLNEDADAIAAAIDGTTPAAGVAEASGRDPFNVYRLLHALDTLQLLYRVEEVRPEPAAGLDEMPAAGVADAADLWEEPQPEPEVIEPVAPRFEFDEAEAARQPTLNVAIDTSLLPPYPDGNETPAAPVSSAWDEPDEEPAGEPVREPVETRMPAWDAPREGIASIPAAVAPAAEARDQWGGFDEAQLETASTGGAAPPAAAVPARSVAARRKSRGGRRGLVVALTSLVIIGLAGYGLYFIWKLRQEPAEEAVATAPKPAVAPPPALTTDTAAVSTGTIVDLPETAAAAPGTAAPVASPGKAPPAPVGTPAPAGTDEARARFDAIARQYLASATGNFTVQIQILCDAGNLANVIRDGGEEVWFVPQPIGERSCYRVLWGRYDTREEAQRALSSIPSDVRDRSAAVKPVPRP